MGLCPCTPPCLVAGSKEEPPPPREEPPPWGETFSLEEASPEGGLSQGRGSWSVGLNWPTEINGETLLNIWDSIELLKQSPGTNLYTWRTCKSLMRSLLCHFNILYNLHWYYIHFSCRNKKNYKDVFDRLKQILRLRENPPHPPGTFRISSQSSTNKIHDVEDDPLGHSFKSPVRNPQRPPSPKFMPDISDIESSSNFQDMSLVTYWHDL